MISEQEFREVKEELAAQKKANDERLVKNEVGKKQLRQMKE